LDETIYNFSTEGHDWWVMKLKKVY
jgi:hypothetical protein